MSHPVGTRLYTVVYATDSAETTRNAQCCAEHSLQDTTDFERKREIIATRLKCGNDDFI